MAGLGKQTRGTGIAKIQRQEFKKGGKAFPDLTGDGKVTLPEQTADAYMFAYALGYTLNFLLAAAFPLGQSLPIIFSSLIIQLLKEQLLLLVF